MARIRFETGQTVNFEGDPTPEDVEEVAASLGIKKEKSLAQRAKEFGTGVLKSIPETIKGALEAPAQLGRAIAKPFEQVPEPIKKVATSVASAVPQFGGLAAPIIKTGSQVGERVAQKIPKELYEAKTPEERAGKLTGEIAQAFIPTGVGAVKAAKPVGGLLERAGEKILSTVIRPTQADVRAGFKVQNVAKHDVGGSLQEMLEKTTEKIKSNVDQVKQRLQAAPYNANVDDVITQTEESLKKGGLAKFGNVGSLERGLNDLKEEIGRLKEQGLIKSDGTLSVADLQEIKQAAGLQGAWNYGRPDREAKALETVYNQFYLNAKKEIENKSPRGIQELNKILSELIPIQHAIIRRLPVAERNNPISLTDVITLTHSFSDPRTLSLYLLNKLSKSGKVGEAFIKGGQKLQDIRLPFPKDRGAIPPTTIRKITPEPLAQEARKYKSAEEFVRAQQPTKVTFQSATTKSNYMGGHEAPMAEDINAPIWDLTGKYTGNNLYPEDVYLSDAARSYSSGFDYDQQAISILQSVHNRPNAKVIVYRSVPKDIKGEINPGDWITLTKEYAKEHGESNLNGKFKIVQKEVHARDIFTDANSIQEFGYDPQPRLAPKDTPYDLLSKGYKDGKTDIHSAYQSQLTDIWNQAVKKPIALKKDEGLKAWFEGPEGETDIGKITQRLAEKHRGDYDIQILDTGGEDFVTAALKPGALPEYIQNIVRIGVKKGYYKDIDDVHGFSYPNEKVKRPVILPKAPYLEQRAYHEIGHHITENASKEAKQLAGEIDHTTAKRLGLISSEFGEDVKETIPGIIRVFYTGKKEQKKLAGDLLKKYGLLSLMPFLIPYKEQR